MSKFGSTHPFYTVYSTRNPDRPGSWYPDIVNTTYQVHGILREGLSSRSTRFDKRRSQLTAAVRGRHRDAAITNQRRAEPG